MELKGTQRKYLRSLAHHLNPHVIVGKNKLSNNTINFIQELFNIHELIKVKFIDGNYKKSLKVKIPQIFDCHIVGDIGKILILYRQQEDLDLRKIDLPS